MLELLDSLFRYAAVGAGVLGVAVILRAVRRTVVHGLTAGFLCSVVAYLVLSSPASAALPGLVRVVLLAFATVGAALLWLTSRGLFVDGFRLSRLDLAPVILLAALGLFAHAAQAQQAAWASAAIGGYKVAAIVLYVHAVWCAWTGYRADLIEARRRFRLLFVCTASAVGLAIIIAEVALSGQAVPGELELLKVVTIAFLATGLLAWSFELRIDWLAGRESVPPDEMPAGERQLLAALLGAMDRDRVYREPGLTIAALAVRLKAPETLLRRLINRRLGHRNFNAFLNERRIQEVVHALSDPARARLPVLSMALDSGFGSIGPFNRAFKEALGVTPTEFRRQKLSAAESDPEGRPKAEI